MATLAALTQLQRQELDKKALARQAHQVELKVQGAASPLDTAVSTHGGMVHLHPEGKVENLEVPGQLPLVVAYTSYRGNTGELVAGVRQRREHYPEVVDPILEAMEMVTHQARQALLDGQERALGDLMNTTTDSWMPWELTPRNYPEWCTRPDSPGPWAPRSPEPEEGAQS